MQEVKKMTMKYRNERKVSISKSTIILATVATIVVIGVLSMLLATGESTVTGGAIHSSSSPFSPVINYHDKPLIDPAASLAKQIEVRDGLKYINIEIN